MQIGAGYHYAGKSHNEDYGYPGWGDSESSHPWNKYALVWNEELIQYKLSDLVRLTEKAGPDCTSHCDPQEFSILSSLKTDKYIEHLNLGSFGKEYNEVADLRLESIEWREWSDKGFLEGLRFNWSNGTSTARYAEGSRHDLKKSTIGRNQQIRKIVVEHNDFIVVRIQLFDNQGNLCGDVLGNTESQYVDKNSLKTKEIQLNPGEVIIGVNIQEVGFDKGKESWDGQIDEFHIGSIQFQVMQLRQA